MGDFVKPNKHHNLNKSITINESYNINLGYGTTYSNGEDQFNEETSTANYFKSSTKNINNFSMTIYQVSTVDNVPTTKSHFDYNFTTNLIEVSDTFLYIKSGMALVLLIVGLLANGLSFLIIVQQGLIKSGIWVYLAALACTDSLALIMGCIHEFSKPPVYIFGNIQNNNDIFCKFFTSFSYLWTLMSNYIISFMSIERCIIILNPYKVPPGQKRATFSVMIIIAVILIAQPTYVFNCFGLVEFDALDLKFCTMFPKYENISSYIFMTEALILAVIPIILVTVANFCIIFSLIKRHKNEELNKVHKNAKKDINISIMLGTISLLFLISLTPSVVYYLIWNYFYDTYERAIAFDSIGWTVVCTSAIMNHSFNFFAYVLTGEIFREKLVLFFRSICCRGNPHQVG